MLKKNSLSSSVIFSLLKEDKKKLLALKEELKSNKDISSIKYLRKKYSLTIKDANTLLKLIEKISKNA